MAPLISNQRGAGPQMGGGRGDPKMCGAAPQLYGVYGVCGAALWFYGIYGIYGVALQLYGSMGSMGRPPPSPLRPPR